MSLSFSCLYLRFNFLLDSITVTCVKFIIRIHHPFSLPFTVQIPNFMIYLEKWFEAADKYEHIAEICGI